MSGAALHTLYITNARDGLSADELRDEPLNGAVFAAAVGVRGLAEARFAGIPEAPPPPSQEPARGRCFLAGIRDLGFGICESIKASLASGLLHTLHMRVAYHGEYP